MTRNTFEAKGNSQHKLAMDAACGEIAELRALLAKAEKVIDQFMPNAANCFGVDYGLVNETLVEVRAVTGDKS